MYLDYPIVGKHSLIYVPSDSRSLIVACVVGVYTHAGHDDAGLLINLRLELSRQAVYLFYRHGIRQLNMNGCKILIRSVIVDNQVICTSHILFLCQKCPDFRDGLLICPCPQNVIQRLNHHLNT